MSRYFHSAGIECPQIKKRRRRGLIPLAGISLALALPALGEPLPEAAVPPVHEKARYDTLRAHSPFTLATEAAVAPAPQASFAANWYVSGIGRIGDTDFVTIKSRDQAQQFSLYGRNPENLDDPNSVALVSVNWSDDIGKSTVILRKGTETAHLEFNEAELHTAAAAPVAPTAPVNRTAVANVRPSAPAKLANHTNSPPIAPDYVEPAALRGHDFSSQPAR
jgi:hypothetical protein